MKSSSAKYLFGEGMRNVWTNKLMSLASIGVLTACLLMVGFAILLTSNLNAMVGYVGEQSTVVVFIQDGSSDADVQQLKNTLQSNKDVKSITYISKDDALESYSHRVNNEEAINSLREENVLPASFEVSLTDLAEMDNIIAQAKQSPACESVTAPTNVASTINDLNRTIGWFGAAIIVALVLVSLVIISNTIRATVFARHREIAIMKQVGATDNFVRIPFLVEGVAIGVVSAIVAFCFTWIGYLTIVGVLQNNSSAFLQAMFSSLVPFWSLGWMLMGGFLLGGMLAGVMGSAISLRKHLKV